MATLLIPQFTSVMTADTVATINTVSLRDSLGGSAFVQALCVEVKSTGILTLPVSPSKTVSFTADGTAVIWLCNATAAAIVATLPPAATCTGRVYVFKKTDAVANNVTVTGNAAETIDGANTKVLSTQFSRAFIVSDGSGWQILN